MVDEYEQEWKKQEKQKEACFSQVVSIDVYDEGKGSFRYKTEDSFYIGKIMAAIETSIKNNLLITIPVRLQANTEDKAYDTCQFFSKRKNMLIGIKVGPRAIRMYENGVALPV